MSHEPTVVFDVGNVLLDWNPRHLYRKIIDDDARMEWFLEHVCSPSWNVQQDGGRTFAEAVAERISLFPDWEHEVRAFDTRWLETVSGPIAKSVEVLRGLVTRKAPVYAITNFSSEKWRTAQAHFDFLRLFEGAVVSGEERLLKPDPAIYHLLLSRYGLEAGSCIFVDDSAANIAGALSVGMKAIHFGPQTDLVGELVRHGVRL